MERLSGNDGKDLKYVVIAKNGNVALGLYLSAHRDGNRDGEPYSVGGRLRAAAAPDCEATAQEVNDAFKGLPFEKFASDDGGWSGCCVIRASCTVAFFTSQQDRAGIPEAFDALNIGQKVIDFLLKGIDETLLTVTAKDLTEILKAEIATESTETLAGLALAQKIANTDDEFMVEVQAVTEILIQGIETIEAKYAEDIKFVKAAADEAATKLVAEFEKTHPKLTLFVPEPDQQEFGLYSLAYGDENSGDDEVGYYNA